jgi:SAM-dependent methyltransferase
MLKCVICGDVMQLAARSWLYICACGYQASTLQPQFDRTSLDEAHRETSLAPLRSKNFGTLLDLLLTTGAKPGMRLLDVGCAHGWFVKGAASRGLDAMGLEPDAALAASNAAAGLNVIHGLFPDALQKGQVFDIMTFNDVFEHLPDIDAAMASCAAHLAPGGLLMINLPNVRGFLFQITQFANRLGVGSPMDRMWQLGFPSPHLHYLSPSHLSILAGRHGFVETYRTSLPSVGFAGLWSRLRYDKSSSLAHAVVYFAALLVLVPLTRIMPPDISVQIFRNRTG